MFAWIQQSKNVSSACILEWNQTRFTLLYILYIKKKKDYIFPKPAPRIDTIIPSTAHWEMKKVEEEKFTTHFLIYPQSIYYERKTEIYLSLFSQILFMFIIIFCLIFCSLSSYSSLDI